MPSPISEELRQRVVEAHLAGRGTYLQLAELFEIGPASVSRWLRLHREKGELAPEPPGGGTPARIPKEQYGTLKRLVAEKPDRIVEELRNEWEKRFGVNLSRSAMQRALLGAGITWKKKGSAHPSKIARKSKTAERRSLR